MAFCSFCGGVLPEGANFCDKCGMQVPQIYLSLNNSSYSSYGTPVRRASVQLCQYCGSQTFGNSVVCQACKNRVKGFRPVKNNTLFTCPCCGSLRISKVSTRRVKHRTSHPVRLFSRRTSDRLGCLFGIICVMFPPIFVIWVLLQIFDLTRSSSVKIKSYRCAKCGYTWEV